MPLSSGSSRPPLVFILSWERPLFTWSCLDSLYRHTKSPARFVIADNASKDPMVKQVIDGFERRGMFHGVHFFDDNNPRRLGQLAEMYWDEIDDFFVFIESDIAVFDDKTDWLERFDRHIRRNPKLGSVGSIVHKSDFVSMKDARKLEPELSTSAIGDLIKIDAPMRRYKPGIRKLASPHNPALRLLALRKEAYAEVGFGRDTEIHQGMIAKGWKSMIAKDVEHRHLSLLNIYDYPGYDVASRNDYFDFDTLTRVKGQGEPLDNTVLILGMHRSGTSCLTGSLQEAGLHLGDVVEVSPFNKKGNRESKTIMRLHDAVLKENGGTWDAPPQTVTWSQSSRNELDEVIEDYRGNGRWGVKDPRLLLLIDEWIAKLNSPALVGTVRHPAKVVQSLINRAPEKAKNHDFYGLYATYNERLLALWKSNPFPIINFDWEAGVYAERVRELTEYLGLSQTKNAGAAFFDDQLRASTSHENAPAPVEALYQELAAIAEKPISDYL